MIIGAIWALWADSSFIYKPQTRLIFLIWTMRDKLDKETSWALKLVLMLAWCTPVSPFSHLHNKGRWPLSSPLPSPLTAPNPDSEHGPWLLKHVQELPRPTRQSPRTGASHSWARFTLWTRLQRSSFLLSPAEVWLICKGRAQRPVFPWSLSRPYTLNWPFSLTNIQIIYFSSVTQSCPTLCDPMDCSTPGRPVHHQLPELIQTHVHWVGDAIQPLHPVSSPSPPVFNLSQPHSLFKWVFSK